MRAASNQEHVIMARIQYVRCNFVYELFPLYKYVRVQMVMPSIFLSTQKIGEPKSILSFDVILSVEFPERETKIRWLLQIWSQFFFLAKLELTEFQKYIKIKFVNSSNFQLMLKLRDVFWSFFWLIAQKTEGPWLLFITTGTPPLTRFSGPGKNRVKGKPRYRRSILVLKPQNGEFERSKSTFSRIFLTIHKNLNLNLNNGQLF